MIRRWSMLSLCLCGLAATGCTEPLCRVYQDDFLLGAALGSRDINHAFRYPMQKDRGELLTLAREFNAVTPENLMKWEYLQPEEGRFNFEQADEFMKWAEKNRLAVVGHVLVWHAQTPGWVFEGKDGRPPTREQLIARMRNHIHTVVGRYKGKIKYWDVVNEAVATKWVVDESLPPDEEGNPQKKQIAFYRESPWKKIIGEEYLALAFRFAHEADPAARLLYNDYSLTDASKTEFVAKMVERLRAEGVPVHGIGMQGHWHLEYPTPEELAQTVDRLTATGAKVSITELDINILPRPENHEGADIRDHAELRAELNPYTNGVPPEVLQEQADKYAALFRVLLDRKDVVERVTFWGVSDKYSWRNNYPVHGRTAYPLLFDRRHRPKPAYFALKRLKHEK